MSWRRVACGAAGMGEFQLWQDAGFEQQLIGVLDGICGGIRDMAFAALQQDQP